MIVVNAIGFPQCLYERFDSGRRPKFGKALRRISIHPDPGQTAMEHRSNESLNRLLTTNAAQRTRCDKRPILGRIGQQPDQRFNGEDFLPSAQ